MRAKLRWCVAVLAAAGSFALVMWVLILAAKLDSALAAGIAVVPFTIVLTVLGEWAHRAQKSESGQPGTRSGHRVSQTGAGVNVNSAGGRLLSSIINVIINRSDQNRLLPEPSELGRVRTVGDVPLRPAAFLERAELLNQLDAGHKLDESKIFVLTGPRGSGKTQIAAEHARRRIDDGWRLVAWIEAQTPQSMMTGLLNVTSHLGLTRPNDATLAAAARARHYLESNGDRCLVVFDDVANLNQLRRFLPAAGDAQIVVTSARNAAARLGKSVPVSSFTMDEAEQFLAAQTAQTDQAGARELADELDCLPLALAQATALIVEQKLDYHTYLDQLRSMSVSDYLRPPDGDGYEHGVAEAILLSLTGLQDDSGPGLCSTVMDLIAVLSEVGVSRAILRTAARSGGIPGLAAGKAAITRLDSAVGRLADMSLVTFSINLSAVMAHPLVMRVAREWRAEDGTLGEVLTRTATALTAVADTIQQAWQERATVGDLIQQVAALKANFDHHNDGKLTGNPATMLQLRERTLRLLYNLGDDPHRVLELAEPLVTDCTQALGPDDQVTLRCRITRARAQLVTEDAGRSIPLFESILDDQERLLGADHPDTLATRNDLAVAYHRLAVASDAPGHLAAAVALFESALEDRERLLGTGHPDTLTTRNDLALAYWATNQLDRAVPMFEETLADRERLLHRDHPDILTTRDNLARAYVVSKLPDKAIPLFERSLDDRARLFGRDDHRTLATGNNLARAYRLAGRPADAVKLYEQILPASERVLGDQHSSTQIVRRGAAVARRQAREHRQSREGHQAQIGRITRFWTRRE